MSVSYIGSKISLISKAEIRYEGTLHEVDVNQATITLSKVRTFGTENRPAQHPMPARDELFEFIIFKASDIKDILVCETALNNNIQFVDPAIVSVSKAPTSPQNLQQQHLLSTDLTTNSGAVKLEGRHSSRSLSPPGHILSGLQSRAPGAGRRDSQPMGGGVIGMFPGGGGPPTSMMRQQQHHQGQSGTGSSLPMRGGFGFGPNMNSHQQHHQHAPQPPLHRPYSRRDDDVESVEDSRSRNSFNREGNFNRPRGSSRLAADFSRGGGANNNYRGGGGYNTMAAGGRGGGGFVPRGYGHRGGSFGGHHPNSGRRYDNDYDFEKANEKFQETMIHLKDEFAKAKIEAGKENESGEVTPKQHVGGSNSNMIMKTDQDDDDESDDGTEDSKKAYNKDKSFFDHISCEALENLEGKNSKPNRRREREINQETFGIFGGGMGGGGRPYQYRRGMVRMGGPQQGPGGAGGGGYYSGGMRGTGGGGYGFGGPRRGGPSEFGNGGGGGHFGAMGGESRNYNRYR